MKFKEIKPGMVIHCPKEEDAETLLEHLEELGYYWANGACATDHSYGAGYYKISSHENKFWLDCGIIMDEITEFSDLIEPDDSPINSPADSPMTAVEVLEWLKDNRHSGGCVDVFGSNSMEYIFASWGGDSIVNKITAYEAAKKEQKREARDGFRCQIYGDGLVEAFDLWDMSREEAEAETIKHAHKYTTDTGIECSISVWNIYRVKEDEP